MSRPPAAGRHRGLAGLAIATLLAAVTATACSAGAQAPSGDSAVGFAEAVGQGRDLDYDRLASPADAVAKGELIVRGTVVDVGAGVTFGGPGAAEAGRTISFATLVIRVDETIKGDVPAGGTVHALVSTGSRADAADLAGLNRRFAAVAVLDDISAWRPTPSTTVVRPDVMPADGPLYMAFPDGLWLQGRADTAMVGPYADVRDLPPQWGPVRTVDRYAAALRDAAT